MLRVDSRRQPLLTRRNALHAPLAAIRTLWVAQTRASASHAFQAAFQEKSPRQILLHASHVMLERKAHHWAPPLRQPAQSAPLATMAMLSDCPSALLAPLEGTALRWKILLHWIAPHAQPENSIHRPLPRMKLTANLARLRTYLRPKARPQLKIAHCVPQGHLRMSRRLNVSLALPAQSGTPTSLDLQTASRRPVSTALRGDLQAPKARLSARRAHMGTRTMSTDQWHAARGLMQLQCLYCHTLSTFAAGLS